MRDASYWIERFGLVEHPEGGYYHETHRSVETIPGSALAARYGGDRRTSTAIYFLLKGARPSLLHRLKSEEIWHFYAGAPVTVHIINRDGLLSHVRLGPGDEHNQVFQGIIPSNSWFGAVVDDPHGYALVGCTVAPGFEFEDFELAERDVLLERYPQHQEIIRMLTR